MTRCLTVQRSLMQVVAQGMKNKNPYNWRGSGCGRALHGQLSGALRLLMLQRHHANRTASFNTGHANISLTGYGCTSCLSTSSLPYKLYRTADTAYVRESMRRHSSTKQAPCAGQRHAFPAVSRKLPRPHSFSGSYTKCCPFHNLQLILSLKYYTITQTHSNYFM